MAGVEELKSRTGERSLFDGRTLPGYVNFEAVDVSGGDYDPGRPFHLEVRVPGSGTVVNCRPVGGDSDLAISVTAAGLIGVSGYGLILSAVRAIRQRCFRRFNCRLASRRIGDPNGVLGSSDSDCRSAKLRRRFHRKRRRSGNSYSFAWRGRGLNLDG